MQNWAGLERALLSARSLTAFWRNKHHKKARGAHIGASHHHSYDVRESLHLGKFESQTLLLRLVPLFPLSSVPAPRSYSLHFRETVFTYLPTLDFSTTLPLSRQYLYTSTAPAPRPHLSLVYSGHLLEKNVLKGIKLRHAEPGAHLLHAPHQVLHLQRQR